MGTCFLFCMPGAGGRGQGEEEAGSSSCFVPLILLAFFFSEEKEALGR